MYILAMFIFLYGQLYLGMEPTSCEEVPRQMQNNKYLTTKTNK